MHKTMQHMLAGGGGVVALAVLATFFILYGRAPSLPPPAQEEPSPSEVSFSTITAGEHAKVTNRVNYLITSQGELNELWKLLDVKTTEPEIDFSTQAVAAVFAGTQPTTGYAIKVTKIEDAAQRMVVVNLVKPGSGCMTAQTITTPFEVVAFPKTTLPLSHEDAWTDKDCN